MRSAVVSASSSWSIKRIQLIYVLINYSVASKHYKLIMKNGDIPFVWWFNSQNDCIDCTYNGDRKGIKWDMEITPLPFDPYHPVPRICFTIHQPEIMQFGDDPRNVRSLWLHLATWLWPGIFMGILDDKHLETQVWERSCWSNFSQRSTAFPRGMGYYPHRKYRYGPMAGIPRFDLPSAKNVFEWCLHLYWSGHAWGCGWIYLPGIIQAVAVHNRDWTQREMGQNFPPRWDQRSTCVWISKLSWCFDWKHIEQSWSQWAHVSLSLWLWSSTNPGFKWRPTKMALNKRANEW